MFALANIASEHRFADQPQVESCIVAENLPVVGRVAIDEFDREADHFDDDFGAASIAVAKAQSNRL